MITRFVLAFVVCVMWAGPSVAGMLPIQTVTSAGKVTAWLVEDHTVPVVSLTFSFRGAGAVNDPENKQGLSRMLSNTLDEGAGPLDSKAFQAALNDQSISLSFFASRDDFGGKLKTLSQNREEAFYLLRLALTKPRLEKEAIERMRDANLSRIKGDMTDPNWMAARLVNDVVFHEHPYALNSGGTLTTLKNITAIDLREKAAAQLTRDRLIVGVAGDITSEQLKLALDKTFGELPEKAVTLKIAEVTLPPQGSMVLYTKDIPQTVFEMVLPGIRMTDPDYFAATVMNHIFGGGGFGSRLTDVVREKNGLTYGISSDVSEMDYVSLFTISSSTRNETVQTLLDLTKNEMERIKKELVTDQELEDAKAYIIGSVPLGLTSTSQISETLLTLQRHNLPVDFLDRREQAVRAVSKADVARVAERLLIPEKPTIILVGQPKLSGKPRVVDHLSNVE